MNVSLIKSRLWLSGFARLGLAASMVYARPHLIFLYSGMLWASPTEDAFFRQNGGRRPAANELLCGQPGVLSFQDGGHDRPIPGEA